MIGSCQETPGKEDVCVVLTTLEAKEVKQLVYTAIPLCDIEVKIKIKASDIMNDGLSGKVSCCSYSVTVHIII